MARLPSPAEADSGDTDEAAAEWIVRLSADDPAERRRAEAGYAAWKAADPRHAAAAAEMEAFLAQARRFLGGDDFSAPGAGEARATRWAARTTLSGLLGRPVRGGQDGRSPRLRRAGGVLALAVALAIPAFLILGSGPAVLLADLHTGVGERRSEVLSDGTRIILTTSSAANLNFDARLRRVELLQGEIHLEVAKDSLRPFVVDTREGRIRALGTRFIVRREADVTLLTMLESRTRVSPAGALPEAGETIVAGQQVRLSGKGLEILGTIDAELQEEAFSHHRLVVHDRPLAEVLDELGRHHRGVIRYRQQDVKGLRVNAVLPLDDPDQALRLLVADFPGLRLRTLTPWLVLIGPAG